MAKPLIATKLGLDPQSGEKAILEVRAYLKDRGSISSGYSYLRVTVCPHP